MKVVGEEWGLVEKGSRKSTKYKVAEMAGVGSGKTEMTEVSKLAAQIKIFK